MRKLVCLLVSVCGFLQSVTLPSLYPTFLPGDFSPYLVAQIMSPGSLQFNVTSQTAYSVALNATTVGGYLGNQTVTLPALSTGVTQMSISNGVSVYTFVLLVSSVSKFTHTVTVGSTFCAPNCGNFAYSLPMTVGASTQMQGMIFNYVSRLVHWTPILGSQSFPTVAWDNYVIVLEGSGVALHSGYSSARSNEIVSMVWNTTLGFSDFFVTPRFHPEQMSYTLLPMLDSVVGFGVTLAVTCSGACNIAISSQNANFGTITTTSAVASLPINLPVNDTVIVTSTDPSGILSTNYYAIAVNAKSRNRFLSALAMYIAPVGSSYVSDTDYNSLFLAVQSDSLLQFNQPFSTVTLSYTLPNFDYNSTLLLVVVANAESALSTLSIRSNNTSLTDYWSSTKTFSPVIGPNVISVIVIAQDVGYSSIVNIAFRMRANNTNIDVLSIGGGSWSSPFSPSVYQYQVGLPANLTSFPLFVHTTDPNALISFSPSYQNVSGTLNATVPLPVLKFYNQSIVLQVNAETYSISQQTIIWLWKMDVCGNGLRYSSAEQCDVGNLLNGYGCDSNCKIEPGFTCSGGSETQPDVCTKIAQPGNNSTESTNSTVPTNSTSTNSTNSTNPSNSTSTNSTSTSPANSTAESPGNTTNSTTPTNSSEPTNSTNSNPVCGNGLIESGEECDDGNTLPGDGCSATCTVEPGWTCSVSPITNLEECTKTSVNLLQTDVQPYFDYHYIGVSFGFPFTVLLLFLLAGVFILRFKFPTHIGLVSLASGAAYLIMLMQLLYILQDADTESNRSELFSGFSWAHLQFNVAYPPFHSRLLLDLESSANIRFFDFSLIFLLIIAVTGLVHGVLYYVKRPWAATDDWLKVYFLVYQVTHVPIFYYGVKCVASFGDARSRYDDVNVTFALIAIIVLTGVVLLYSATHYRAWTSGSFPHSETVRKVLCPGIRKPTQTLEKDLGLSASVMRSPVLVPKRLNHSFDETAVRDNNGFDEPEVGEESTARARIMSEDIQKKKQGAAPNFSQYLNHDSVLKVHGYIRSLTYALHFAEILIVVTVLAAGDSLLGRLLPPLIISLLIFGFHIWQRPFETLRCNLLHSCTRVTWALLLLLLSIGEAVDDGAVLAVLFLHLCFVFAFQVTELGVLAHTVMTQVGSPVKSPVEEVQGEVRAFTLQDNFSADLPASIPDERHASSEIINEGEPTPKLSEDQEDSQE